MLQRKETNEVVPEGWGGLNNILEYRMMGLLKQVSAKFSTPSTRDVKLVSRKLVT